MKPSTAVAVVAVLGCAPSEGFQIPSATKSLSRFGSRGDRVCRHVAEFPIIESADSFAGVAGHVVDTCSQYLQQHRPEFDISSLPSMTLADDAAAVVADENDWWQTYISFFKQTLRFVHSSIDEPLRAAGWEQTWGVSIFLFTFGVRSLLIPVSLQQSKSTEKTKALKPYQDEIRKKFADKKEIMNRAMGKLYEDAGANPLSGCLFSLLQLPVFLGLYRSITGLAKEGELREPFLWIPSLAGPVSPPTYRGMDWLTSGWTFPEGGLPTPQLGWETTLAFLIMPIVLVLGQSFTMSVLSPPVDDEMSEEEKKTIESSQRILKFLPLMIGYFSLQVPAGLTIYWLTSNGFTLLQSLGVKAYYAANPPKVELPDYWDALDDAESMSAEEKRAAAEAGLATGPKFEDLLDRARCHYVVERAALREGSEAWTRVQENQSAASGVPDEMAVWAKGDEITITAESRVAESSVAP